MPEDVNAPIRIAPVGPEGPIPTLVFLPEERGDRLPFVLMGHGAHLGKDDPIMQLLCRALTRVPAAVAVMDAPGHGERRTPGLTDEEFETDVYRRIGDPAVHEKLRAEWPLVAAATREAAPAVTGPVAYAGFSMGSIFGLSIVGDLPEVESALFVVGGYVTDERPHSSSVNALIAAGLPRLAGRNVMMVNMTADESFPINRAVEVLESIPGRPSMHVYVGGHRDLPPESMSQMLRFLRRALTEREVAPVQ
jgi:predicted esterase